MIFYNITISSFLNTRYFMTKKSAPHKKRGALFLLRLQIKLQNKHGITIGEEIIFFFYRNLVYFLSKFITHES